MQETQGPSLPTPLKRSAETQTPVNTQKNSATGVLSRIRSFFPDLQLKEKIVRVAQQIFDSLSSVRSKLSQEVQRGGKFFSRLLENKEARSMREAQTYESSLKPDDSMNTDAIQMSDQFY